MNAILLKEWRVLAASSLIWTVPLLILIAVGWALQVGAEQQAREMAMVASYEAADAARWGQLSSRARAKFEDHLGSPYYVGQMAETHCVLPASAVSLFAQGSSRLYARVVKVGLFPDRAMNESEKSSNSSLVRMGPFDFAFVVLFLMPLLLIALLHGVRVQEREQGIARLELSLPVSRLQLLFVPILLRSSLVLVPLAAVIGGAALIMQLPGAQTLQATGVVLLYLSFWIALCAGVVSIVKTPASSALLLGVCWALLVIVLPAGISLLAQSIHPVAADTRISVIRNEINDDLHKEWRNDNELFRAFYTDHPDRVPQSVTVLADRIIDRSEPRDRERRVPTAISYAMVKGSQPLEDAELEKSRAQDELARELGQWVPTLIAYDALVELAGTSASRHAAFLQQARQYRDRWEDVYVRRLFLGPEFTIEDFRAKPEFVWREPARSVPLHPLLLSFLLTAGLSCAAAFAAARNS